MYKNLTTPINALPDLHVAGLDPCENICLRTDVLSVRKQNLQNTQAKTMPTPCFCSFTLMLTFMHVPVATPRGQLEVKLLPVTSQRLRRFHWVSRTRYQKNQNS